MPNGKYTYNVPFIREENGCITNFAIAVIHTREKADAREEQIQAIKEAVTAWVKNTKEGKKCWEDSMEDLNIGDLNLWSRHFQTFLTNYKGNLCRFDIKVMDDGEDCIAYDCPLVLVD